MLVRPISTAPAALQPRHDRGIGLGGRRIVERPRARQSALAGDVEEILDRDGNARQRRGHVAGGAQPVLASAAARAVSA